MADAVLNGLTNNRHANFLETRRARQEREKQLLREAGKGNEKSPQVQSKEQVASEGDGGTQGGGSSPLADDVMPEAQVDGGGVEEGGSVRGGGVEEGGSVKGDSSGGVEEGGSVRGDSSGGVEEGRSVTGDSSGGVEEGRSVRGDSSGGESGEGVDETTSDQPENADSTSEEEHSSMELEINQVWYGVYSSSMELEINQVWYMEYAAPVWNWNRYSMEYTAPVWNKKSTRYGMRYI